jgi:hypothetical protein
MLSQDPGNLDGSIVADAFRRRKANAKDDTGIVVDEDEEWSTDDEESDTDLMETDK